MPASEPIVVVPMKLRHRRLRWLFSVFSTLTLVVLLGISLLALSAAAETHQAATARADHAWHRSLATRALAVVLAILGAAAVGYAQARGVERMLSAQRARLAQAEKMSALGEMAAAVAHEVLNPLTGVKTAVQLLARS